VKVAHPQANDPLLIEDPVNVMNNVAKNCFNALAVQRVFLEAHDKFKNVVTRYSGRAGSALSLAKGGSVIDDVFGISLTKVADYTAHHSTDSSSQSPAQTQTQTQTRDHLSSNFGDDEILLYRKQFPSMSAQEASEMMAALPKQLLADIVRSKKSSAGVILGLEFQKVLHEMLLNQKSDTSMNEQAEALQALHLAVPSPSGVHHGGGGNNGKKSPQSGGNNHKMGIASSPKSPKSRKKKSPTKSSSACGAGSLDEQFLASELCPFTGSTHTRPPSKKRPSSTHSPASPYTHPPASSTRHAPPVPVPPHPPPPVASSPPRHSGTEGRS
jgi:hypothetical protein